MSSNDSSSSDTKITSSKFSYFSVMSRGEIPSRCTIFCITFSLIAVLLFCLLRSFYCYVFSTHRLELGKRTNFFINRIGKKTHRALFCGKPICICYVVMCVCERAGARCVWLKSSEFPLISWTSCASMVLFMRLGASSSIQPTPMLRALVAQLRQLHTAVSSPSFIVFMENCTELIFLRED